MSRGGEATESRMNLNGMEVKTEVEMIDRIILSLHDGAGASVPVFRHSVLALLLAG